MTAPTATDPVDRIRQALLERGLSVRNDRGHKLSAQCPAHEDKHPSLDVATGKNGDAILICRAGCPTDQILAALDLHPRDLFATARGSNGRHDRAPDPGQPRTHEADYLYTVGGFELVRKRRYRLADGQKTFTIQHRPDPVASWRPGQGGHQPDPYRLLDWEDHPTRTLFIVEGEKDADRLAQLGLLATTNIGGAGKWPTDWSDRFNGRNIVILADNDPPGHAHAIDVATKLHPHAAATRIPQLPDLPPKGDITDWLDLGHTVNELKQLVATTPTWTPAPPPQSRFRLISIDDLFQLPEPGWLIEHILPQQSFGLIVAPPKQGKTYLLLDWMLHIAAGIDWHHGETVTPGHVVYITGEGITGLARRIRAWQTFNGTPPTLSRFHIVTTMPRVARDGELNELQQQIDNTLDGATPTVIAFDTYARLAAGLDENSSNDMGNVCAHLEDLRDHYRCTTIAAHHTTKDGKEFRGSSAIDGSLEFMTTTKIIESDTPGGPDLLSVQSKYMKSWEQHPPVTLEFRKVLESGHLAPRQGPREDLTVSTWIRALQVTVAETVADDPRTWIRTADVRSRTDLTRTEASRTIKHLVKTGIIEIRGATTNREIRWTEHGYLANCYNNPQLSQPLSHTERDCRGDVWGSTEPPTHSRRSEDSTDRETGEEF